MGNNIYVDPDGVTEVSNRLLQIADNIQYTHSYIASQIQYAINMSYAMEYHVHGIQGLIWSAQENLQYFNSLSGTLFSEVQTAAYRLRNVANSARSNIGLLQHNEWGAYTEVTRAVAGYIGEVGSTFNNTLTYLFPGQTIKQVEQIFSFVLFVQDLSKLDKDFKEINDAIEVLDDIEETDNGIITELDILISSEEGDLTEIDLMADDAIEELEIVASDDLSNIEIIIDDSINPMEEAANQAIDDLESAENDLKFGDSLEDQAPLIAIATILRIIEHRQDGPKEIASLIASGGISLVAKLIPYEWLVEAGVDVVHFAAMGEQYVLSQEAQYYGNTPLGNELHYASSLEGKAADYADPNNVFDPLGKLVVDGVLGWITDDPKYKQDELNDLGNTAIGVLKIVGSVPLLMAGSADSYLVGINSTIQNLPLPGTVKNDWNTGTVGTIHAIDGLATFITQGAPDDVSNAWNTVANNSEVKSAWNTVTNNPVVQSVWNFVP